MRLNKVLFCLVIVAAQSPMWAIESGARESVVKSEKAKQRRSANTLLEEVIVTAQKREENSQDVPIAMSAFTGDVLDDKGFKTITDLSVLEPSLLADEVYGYSVIYIRGVGTDAFVPSADLSVAPYVDGVYFPITFNLAHSLGEVERVEVLKGPQGTLFGRNSTGGAINVVTKRVSEDFTFKIASEIANYNAINNRLYLSSPLTETIGFSLSLVHNTENEYYEPVPSSKFDSFQGRKDTAANVKLQWVPSDNLDAILSAYLFKTEGVGALLSTCVSASPVGAVLGVSCVEGYKSNSNVDAESESDFPVVNFTLNASLPFIDLKSITAFQSLESSGDVDFDGSSPPLVNFISDSFGGDIFTQEFQLISTDDSPFSSYATYILGAYYLESTIYYDPVVLGAAGLDEGLTGTGDLVGLGDVFDALSGLLGSDLKLVEPPEITGFLDTTSYAVFGQTDINFTEWLKVTLGARYQEEERRVYDATVGLGGEATLLDWGDDEQKNNNLSPKVSIAISPYDNVMFYASFQKAFKSGSFNIVNITGAPSMIRPETVVTSEVGWKTDLFDRSFRFNGAVFRNEIDDLQSQYISLLSGGIIQFQNAESALTQGVELQMNWSVNRSLFLSLSGMYLEGEYEKFTRASGYDNLGINSSNNDYSGNTIPRNAKVSGSASATYTWNLDKSDIEASFSYYYNDGYFYDAANSLAQDRFDKVSARLSYYYLPWDLKVSAYGDNLEGTEYYLYQFQTDFGVVGKLAKPRTYGVRLNWEY